MIQTYCGDCMEIMDSLPRESIDIVIMDPPYFRVMLSDSSGKKYDWDNQWESICEYDDWMGAVFDSVKRVCKPTASIYCFADDLVCAHVQIQFEKRFNILNNIVWEKPDALGKKGWKSARKFAPSTERILFGEMERAPGVPATGLEAIHQDPNCFREVRDILIEGKMRAMESMGLDEKGFSRWFSELTGTARMDYHYFGNYQWSLPTESIYRIMQDTGYWTQEYEALRQEYEALRRPFRPKKMITDVWRFNIPRQNENRVHPTQKPRALIDRILDTSARGGGDCMVLDPFMGSGVVGAECIRHGLSYIGVERDPDMRSKADMMIATAKAAYRGRRSLDDFFGEGSNIERHDRETRLENRLEESITMDAVKRIRIWTCVCIGTACEMSSEDDAVPRICPCGYIPHWREAVE